MKQEMTIAWNAIAGTQINRLKITGKALQGCFGRGRGDRRKRKPVPHLSGASKCVWQMDTEKADEAVAGTRCLRGAACLREPRCDEPNQSVEAAEFEVDCSAPGGARAAFYRDSADTRERRRSRGLRIRGGDQPALLSIGLARAQGLRYMAHGLEVTRDCGLGKSRLRLSVWRKRLPITIGIVAFGIGYR